MKYKVLVDDNFHYQDPEERYTLGEYDTLDAAVEAAKGIVDDYLKENYQPEISARALFSLYQSFGEDPFISGHECDGIPFSAWNYAEAQCKVICAAAEAKPATALEAEVKATGSRRET
jgi:hypothetical protein